MARLRIVTEVQDIEEWIGFDLDGVVAVYDGWKGVDHIGEPVPKIIALIKTYLAAGKKVKIFTARVAGDDADRAREVIEAYCHQHIGQVLEVTNEKDQGMKYYFDDRAKQVIPNTGIIV